MKSRICKNFQPRKPVIIDKIEPIGGSLNFSAEFWQPFIDISILNNSVKICGPLLGLAIEIAKSLKLSMTYITAGIKADFDEYFEMMNNNLTNLMLVPFPPMSLTNSSLHMEMSSPIGDISTISILSAKGNPIKSFFHVMTTFRIEVWILIVLSYLFASGMSALLTKNKKQFIRYLAIFFKQQLSKFQSKQSGALIALVWLWSSSMITWALGSALLTFLVFKIPFEKIDSIEDLAKKNINFTLFKGENAMEFITDPNERYFKIFSDKFVIEDPDKDEKEIWEKNLFEKIFDGNYAIVSDEPFLNYHFVTKLIEFPNLYKSEHNELTLPYFIPMSKNNPNYLKRSTNKM
jgi:hypothetical protein